MRQKQRAAGRRRSGARADVDAAFGRAICWPPARLADLPTLGGLKGERPLASAGGAALPFGVPRVPAGRARYRLGVGLSDQLRIA